MNNLDRVKDAIVSQGKRSAIAAEIGISEGQLSKLINGELSRMCRMLEILGLEVVPSDYIAAIERILREKI